MNRKYFLVFLVCTCMFLACLAACGNTEPTSVSVSEETSAQETVEEPEEEPPEEEAYSIDYLILVDGEHPLPEDWEENLQLEETTNSVGDVVRVEKKAYAAYQKLAEELSDEGIHVELDSAFRSVEEQQKIIDDFTEKYGAEYARTYAAVPGYSEHHTGLALDLYLIVDGVTAYENEDLMKYPEVWAKIHEKLPKYGFILRYPGNTGYPYEPWHIRYVGEKAAKEITERGISFEEYWRELD